ncbi:MAG: hypothetical protein WBM50_13625 [Acidimicrobiales bacterium]
MGPQPAPLVDWVAERLPGTTCRQKIGRTILTGIGARFRSDQMVTGERVLYGPDGRTKIRVLGYENGSVAVEHGDHRHAQIRPRQLNLSIRQDPPPSLLRNILQTRRN